MAKSQLPDAPSNLVLVFGSDNVHFQELIEGVRLVMGEESLVGIPSGRVISNDVISNEASMVLIVQNSSSYLSMASAPMDVGNPHSSVTSLLTQLRRQRSNYRQQFDCHNILMFENISVHQKPSTSQVLSAEVGLSSTIVGLNLRETASSLVRRDSILGRGAVAIEALSHTPWIVSSVNIDAFRQRPGILREAMVACLRNAMAQETYRPPAYGFVFFNFDLAGVSDEGMREVAQAWNTTTHDVPMIGFSCQYPFLRWQDHSLSTPAESIVIVLVPK